MPGLEKFVLGYFKSLSRSNVGKCVWWDKLLTFQNSPMPYHVGLGDLPTQKTVVIWFCGKKKILLMHFYVELPSYNSLISSWIMSEVAGGELITVHSLCAACVCITFFKNFLCLFVSVREESPSSCSLSGINPLLIIINLGEEERDLHKWKNENQESCNGWEQQNCT